MSTHLPRTIHLSPAQAWTFARLPDVLADWDVNPGIVLHVGAHHGEEVGVYRQCRFDHIYLVEADPGNVEVLRERYGADVGITVIDRAAVAHPDGPEVLDLYRAERSVWSGLAPHPTATGQVTPVRTRAIGDLLEVTDANVLVLDTQGTELELLKALDDHDRDQLDLIIVETTRRPGDGAALYADAVAFMDQCGWAAVEEWVHDGSGYTDTVFVPGSDAVA